MCDKAENINYNQPQLTSKSIPYSPLVEIIQCDVCNTDSFDSHSVQSDRV